MKLARLLSDCRGLTFVELLFSMTILTIVVYATTSVFAMTGRMYQQSQAESELYSEGVYVMDMIQRGESGLFGIMKGRAATLAIDPALDSATFSVDKNADYTTSTADDITMNISYSNGDGDDSTLEDNVVVIDPNTAVAGDEMQIGRNIALLNFSEAGGIVTVDLTVTRDTRTGPMSVSFSRDILMRN